MNPKSDDAYYNRGIIQYFNNALPSALADFSQAYALEPGGYDTVLWLEIVVKQSKLASRLSETSEQVDMTDWEAPMIRLFLGQMTPEAVLAATSDSQGIQRQVHMCVAQFYIGEWHLLEGRKNDGVEALKTAAATCPTGVKARYQAIAELNRAKRDDTVKPDQK